MKINHEDTKTRRKIRKNLRALRSFVVDFLWSFHVTLQRPETMKIAARDWDAWERRPSLPANISQSVIGGNPAGKDVCAPRQHFPRRFIWRAVMSAPHFWPRRQRFRFLWKRAGSLGRSR